MFAIYKAVKITSLVVEQHCLVYKMCMAKCLNFTTYINRGLGTLAIAKGNLKIMKNNLTLN